MESSSPSPEIHTKTGYISRRSLTRMYDDSPSSLCKRFEYLKRRFMDWLGYFKQQFTIVRTLPGASAEESSPNALSQLIGIAHSDSVTSQRPCSINKLILDTLNDAQQYETLLKCRDRDAQSLLNLFQLHLNTGSMISHLRLRTATRKLAVASGLYPESYYLGNVNISEAVECYGGCANIHRGEWNSFPVCAKVGRRYQDTNIANYSESVVNEVFLWRQLCHPNILPFHGIYRDPTKNQIFLISPWMENRDITEYLKRNPNSNRFHFVVDVAQGLKYLHENGITHRDLKGKNILVNEKGRAVLADFGASFILNDPPSLSALCEGTIRWRAPELFASESSEELRGSEGDCVVRNFEASDVYAFGMVCFEIYTSQIPFSRFKNESAIQWQIVKGKRPERPVKSSDSWSKWRLTEDIWSLMEACWHARPEERPTIQQVVDRLEIIQQVIDPL